ncbi:MAG: hypothetical protein COZ49_03925 [Candidatus Yonathbacteria bacterium CG_4_10_14_3_um_filter_47_65]|uniref:DUF4015 domain-containing protein n=2 Tax=Parcubacteria group TaxID=1794811 RepID=A0A2M8D7Q7_9BACT|nr:MAG: hypothetical protein AUJ44_00295 [Candidatus Nomurabacteria bacterium CG1_02_47_685]PIP03881.1 MAG: hypothetical protein COX54_02020 [Candidatus Yonathbacteria bacterium CG23_combo_of_CG06-09_8_20_14_all_46_18]PIQ32816.1 MAG: hypothetical protein COW61_00835 [Candidatus Yonathbacteria bacterium CG17_big_fil_post_rev_8_21_14_2_50_46_19]PIX56086.1 MAG: hypothetical protein COZ49_03925 [Candidatus Yonathbacteria bacterium CG_4_10_14_3_um_filter_47_65]PIY57808.1 MAG: hypothetical protein CO
MTKRNRKSFFMGAFVVGSLSFMVLYFAVPSFAPVVYDNGDSLSASTSLSISAATSVNGDEETTPKVPPFVVTHIGTPNFVKALYMTSCIAATPGLRSRLVSLADETEINAIVVDIKDYSGTITFQSDDPALAQNGVTGCVSSDLKEFIGLLHKKNIYTIGRITAFQDPYYANKHPELTVKKASDPSAAWKDYKGISYIDVGAKDFWDYIVRISRESYAIGFDELNFDYVRFPSDGNMKDIYYSFSEKEILADIDHGKANILRSFFAYLAGNLSDLRVPLSVDLFGMTTTNSDDLNIGQILEYAEPYFDYIAPMVYPSHYPPTFHGYDNPNHYPYEVVNYSMSTAAERLIRASLTPSKLRPWLQDFDYGGNYDVNEVRAQIRAVYDAGITSWMLWDPSNVYTRGALETAGGTGL